MYEVPCTVLAIWSNGSPLEIGNDVEGLEKVAFAETASTIEWSWPNEESGKELLSDDGPSVFGFLAACVA